MLLNSNISTGHFDSPLPGNQASASHEKAEEVLQSHIIIGFEEALSLGMSPLEALSQVLSWVASEMQRIQTPESAAHDARPSACEG